MIVARSPWVRQRPLLTSFAALILPAIVVGGTAAASSDEASKRRLELDAIRGRIVALETQLTRIDVESFGLEAELERTVIEVRLQEGQVEEARAERRLAEEAVRVTSDEVTALEGRLDRTRRNLERRLESLYRFQEDDLLRSFLSEGDGGTLEDLRLIRLLARGDSYWVDAYLTAKEELTEKRQQQVERQEELGKAVGREAARLRRLARTRAVQSRALELMKARREGIAEKTFGLMEKEEKLALLMSVLAGRDVTLEEGIAIQSFKGALDWPVRGRILQGFGLRSEEIYRTKIPHNGVEIETPPGSDVQVVFPGVVVFAAPFEDFGVTVVVHHPDRVLSLYAGLDAAAVTKGGVLSFSDSLGVARNRLYFEIRVENQPQNPLDWLR